MASKDNVEDRLLVIFPLPSNDPDVDGDPHCVQIGEWNSIKEAQISFMKECEMRDELVLMSEDKDESFAVPPELMLQCIQNLNNKSLAAILNVGRTILLRSCDYTKHQNGAQMWRGKWWTPREIYCESTYLSMAKENAPFAAMIYDKERMETASPEQVREYLTFKCCFMDDENGWEKKKAAQGKHWASKSLAAKHIKDLMTAAHEMRGTLTPYKSSL